MRIYIIYVLLFIAGLQELSASAGRGFAQATSQQFRKAKRSYQRGVNFACDSRDSVKKTVFSMHAWGQEKINNARYRIKVYKEVYQGTRDFLVQEKEKILGFFPGLLIGSFATYRFQDSAYNEQLKKDMEEAVDNNNIYKLVFLDNSTKSTFKDAVDYAVRHDKKKPLKDLLYLRERPEDKSSPYVMKDIDLRMLAAAKINDTDYVYGLITKYNYEIDKAIAAARRAKNKPLLAHLLREKNGNQSSYDTMLAVAALEDVSIIEFMAIGRKAFKDIVDRWFSLSSVGEEPDPEGLIEQAW